MQFIKSFIFSICGASALVSLSKLLLHNVKVYKSVNVFLSLFLLFYMVSPFQKESVNIDFTNSPDFLVPQYSENVNTYSEFIKVAVNKACEEENCTAKSIIIHDNENEGEYIIDYIEVHLEESEKAPRVEEKLRKYYGFEVTVE